MQQIRHAIMQRPAASSADATTAGRAAQLIAAIKLETRWLLREAPVRGFEINEEGHADERRDFVATWPNIRHQRIASTFLISFYDTVADQASRLALLIEIRRQRAANRRPPQ